MRLLISILLIAILSFITEYFFSWWTLAIGCFFVTLFSSLSYGKSFLSGFLGIILLWLVVAFIKDFSNDHILSSRMAKVFHLNSSVLYIIVASLIGGIVGGFAAWSGALVRRYFLHSTKTP